MATACATEVCVYICLLLMYHNVAIKWPLSLLMFWISLLLDYISSLAPNTFTHHHHPIATTTTVTYTNIYHHTVQVAWAQLRYLHQWVKRNHRRKLEWVKPPHVQVEYLCQWLREKRHHRKLLPMTTNASTSNKGQGARCKGQGQHQRKSEWDAATTCNSNHHHHQPAQDQHRRWWSVRCSTHCNLRKGRQFKFLQCPVGRWWWLKLHVVAASCSDLHWCWPWPLYLAPWPLRRAPWLLLLVLAVLVIGSN